MQDVKDKLINELEEQNEVLKQELIKSRKPKFTELKDEDLEDAYIGWLRQDLWDSAEKLRALLAERTAISTKIKTIKMQISRIENSTASNISTEVDDEGRKRFPNETSRKAELDKRLLRNEEYLKLTAELGDLSHKLAENTDNVDVLKFDVRNKRHILDSMPREFRGLKNE